MRSVIKAAVMFLLIAQLWFTSIAGTAQTSTDITGTSSADSPVIIGLRPEGMEEGSRFEITLNEGESGVLTALLENFSAHPIELSYRSGHLVPTVNGGIKLADVDDEPVGSGTWVNFPADTHTFAPGEALEVDFEITVPQGTSPGQYVNAIELKTVEPVQISGAFAQFFSKVISLYITVPGDIVPNMVVGEPVVHVNTVSDGNLQLPISNTGNIRLDLIGTFELTDLDGTPLYNAEVKFGPIYAGQETELRIAIPVVPPAGDYLLNIQLIDSAHEMGYSADSEEISIPEPVATTEAPIRFEDISIIPNAEPVVFANVSVTINSAQSTYQSTRLTMSVFRDGELVEDFVLAENFRLDYGDTVVTQRYLPATAWEPGTYTFSLKLESTEGESTSLLLEHKDVATLEVP